MYFIFNIVNTEIKYALTVDSHFCLWWLDGSLLYVKD